MKGSYVLLIELKHPAEIQVGKLGSIAFPKGFYAYVGSALNGLERRIERHRRKEKKLHWHVDYLLREAEVIGDCRFPGTKRLECGIARKLAKRFESVKGFGCSDCGCESHLFYSEKLKPLRSEVVGQHVNRYIHA